jgi:hypothetical protein
MEEPERAEDQRPFQPFEIRTADGRSITVRHPDILAWDPEPPGTAPRIVEGGGREIIGVALITPLRFPAPNRSSAGDDGV